MVMFHENGQGYFDFDFKVLEGLTSTEFAQKVSRDLTSDFIKKVRFEDGKEFVVVSIIDSGLLIYHQYSKIKDSVVSGVVPMHVARWAVENDEIY